VIDVIEKDDGEMNMESTDRIASRSRRIQFQERSFIRWLVIMLSLWPFIMSLLLAVPGVPGLVKYVADAAWAVMVGATLLGGSVVFQRKILPLIWIVGIFFLYTLFAYLFKFQSPFYYLWGFRNNFRFYIAFFAYVSMADEDDAYTWLKLLDILFWINFFASVIQFVFMGIRQDYLGGIFGISGGTNGYTLMFFSVVVVRSLLQVYRKECMPKQTVMKCSAALLVAAMAEMKFFFLAFIIMLLLAMLITRFSWRKLFVIAISLVVVFYCAQLLSSWFGSGDFMSIENLWDLATKENYSSRNDLNRLSAIATLSKRIVTNPADQLLGLGLGNCDTSVYSIFNSTFYRRYSYLNYTWFTAPMIFLETGYVGLLLYMSFFVCCFFKARKQLKSGMGNSLFCQMTMIMSVLCCIYSFYNSALRIESAYMIYFVLALPFLQGTRSESEELYQIQDKSITSTQTSSNSTLTNQRRQHHEEETDSDYRGMRGCAGGGTDCCTVQRESGRRGC